MFARCQFSQKKNMESWQVDWTCKGRCSVYWSCAILCRTSSFLSVNATRQYSTHQIQETCTTCSATSSNRGKEKTTWTPWTLNNTDIQNIHSKKYCVGTKLWWHTHTHTLWASETFRRSDRINATQSPTCPKPPVLRVTWKDGWSLVEGDWLAVSAGKWYVVLTRKTWTCCLGCGKNVTKSGFGQLIWWYYMNFSNWVSLIAWIHQRPIQLPCRYPLHEGVFSRLFTKETHAAPQCATQVQLWYKYIVTT